MGFGVVAVGMIGMVWWRGVGSVRLVYVVGMNETATYPGRRALCGVGGISSGARSSVVKTVPAEVRPTSDFLLLPTTFNCRPTLLDLIFH